MSSFRRHRRGPTNSQARHKASPTATLRAQWVLLLACATYWAPGIAGGPPVPHSLNRVDWKAFVSWKAGSPRSAGWHGASGRLAVSTAHWN